MPTVLNSENEQEKFVKKIYTDKVKNILKWVLGILIFDFVTYGIFALMGSFDFGVLFEVTTFIFILKAKI